MLSAPKVPLALMAMLLPSKCLSAYPRCTTGIRASHVSLYFNMNVGLSMIGNLGGVRKNRRSTAASEGRRDSQRMQAIKIGLHEEIADPAMWESCLVRRRTGKLSSRQ